jgi:hypothetical protein
MEVELVEQLVGRESGRFQPPQRCLALALDQFQLAELKQAGPVRNLVSASRNG